MAAFRTLLLPFLCLFPFASSCIPTVTPDDMYEDEMDATTSVLLTTVLTMTAETTSPATADPTTTTTVDTTTTTTTTGMCPSASWTINPANNFCYMVLPGAAGMVNNAKCDAVVAGATLASIHDADENAFITNYLVVPINSYVYIGGYSPTGAVGPWTWTDGTTYGPYVNWYIGEPQSDSLWNCIRIGGPGTSYPGKWYNYLCDYDVYGIVCMIAAT